jgi:hypothetical protein
MVRIYLDFGSFFSSADEHKSNVNKKGDKGILQYGYNFTINGFNADLEHNIILHFSY